MNRHPNPLVNARPHYPNEADLTRSKLFVEAVVLMQIKSPAMHSLLMSAVGLVCTRSLPTAGTDGFYLYVNPDYFASLPSVEHRVSLLVHEMLHVALRHPMRGMGYRQRGSGPGNTEWCARTYNVAADYVINDELRHLGLPLGDDWLTHDDYCRDDFVDKVYMDILANRPPEPTPDENPAPPPEGDGDSSQQGDSNDPGDDPGDEDANGEADGDGDPGDGDPGDGEADGPDTKGGEAGESSTNTSSGSQSIADQDAGHDTHLEPQYDGTKREQEEQQKQDEEELGKMLDDAIEAAEQAIEDGDAPRAAKPNDMLRSHGRNAARASATDWRTELQDYLQRAGAGGDANWARIHRSRLSTIGVVAPTRRGTCQQLVITVDISASVSDEACDQFLIECAQAIDIIKPQAVTVLWTNTRVHSVSEVTTGEELLQLSRPCTGGTRMGAAVEWCEANGIVPDLHLIFTDGEMMGNDYARCAKGDNVVMVLDRPFDRLDMWVTRGLLASGIPYVCCDTQQ